MGHQRLNGLPATRTWREIIDLVAQGDIAAEKLVEKLLEAMDEELRRARSGPVYVEVIRLLLGIVDAAAANDFKSALKEAGINVPRTPTELDVIVGFSRAVEEVERRAGGRSDLGEMAKLAVISSLAEIFSRAPPVLQPEIPGLTQDARQEPGLAQRQLSAMYPNIVFADLVQDTAMRPVRTSGRWCSCVGGEMGVWCHCATPPLITGYNKPRLRRVEVLRFLP